jgi:hypothetical protein
MLVIVLMDSLLVCGPMLFVRLSTIQANFQPWLTQNLVFTFRKILRSTLSPLCFHLWCILQNQHFFSLLFLRWTYILAVLPQWVANVHIGRTQKLQNRVHCNQPINKKHIISFIHNAMVCKLLNNELVNIKNAQHNSSLNCLRNWLATILHNISPIASCNTSDQNESTKHLLHKNISQKQLHLHLLHKNIM